MQQQMADPAHDLPSIHPPASSTSRRAEPSEAALQRTDSLERHGAAALALLKGFCVRTSVFWVNILIVAAKQQHLA
jgi:uncharacterized protein (DUF1800 family)